MEVIKEHTISLCPQCYEKIDARILVKDDKVFMEKKCPDHGSFEALVEKDVEFYKKIAKAPKDDSKFLTRCLMINITHGCNLNCHLCYIPERDRNKDFPLEKIKEAISKYPGKLITLSGGEPTTREDLPEIIKYIKSVGKLPMVVTNGVKLTDFDYVKSLKDAGLMALNFSCNGFTEDVFLAIENANLLDIKMKALENVRKAGIKTQFSFTMSEGINDDQFGRALKFILDNEDFIYQIRSRVSTPVGRAFGEKTIYLSDFLNILSKEIGVARDKIVEYWLTYAPYPNPYIFIMNYHYLMAYIQGKEIPPPDGGDMVLFSWPDKYNIDYEEIKALDLDILTNKIEFLPYWDGIVRNEKYNFI